MLEFIAANLAPIMFATLVVFLLAGYPVAFYARRRRLMFFVLGVELAPYSGGAINLSWPLLKHAARAHLRGDDERDAACDTRSSPSWG